MDCEPNRFFCLDHLLQRQQLNLEFLSKIPFGAGPRGRTGMQAGVTASWQAFQVWGGSFREAGTGNEDALLKALLLLCHVVIICVSLPFLLPRRLCMLCFLIEDYFFYLHICSQSQLIKFLLKGFISAHQCVWIQSSLFSLWLLRATLSSSCVPWYFCLEFSLGFEVWKKCLPP